MQSLTTAWTGQAFPISPAQIINTVNHVGVVPKIVPRFKLLDGSNLSTLTPISTGVKGPYGDDGDITKYVTGAVITNDGELLQGGMPKTAVHRSLDLDIKEDAFLVYDPLRHLIQCFVDYYDANWNILFEVPMGIFRFSLPAKTLGDTAVRSKSTLLDLTSRVTSVGFLNTYTVPAGVNYITNAVQNLLTQDDLPASQGGTGATPAGLDDSGPKLSLFDTSRMVGSVPNTPTPIPFTRADGKLTAVNGLLAACSYYPLWLDETGHAVYQPRPNLSVSVPPTTWSYHTDSSSIIHPDSVHWQVTNLADLANIVEVYCENNNAPSFSSIKYNNNNTLSSLCLSRLGYAIHKIINDSKIADQPNCDLRAYVELTNAALIAEKVTFTTAINPFHQTHDYLDVYITDKRGAPLISAPGGFEEISWKADLFARTMDHTVGRMLVL